MNTLNKFSVSLYLHDISGLPKKYCNIFISEYFNYILSASDANRKFLVKYLGKFSVKNTKKRNIKDLSSGENRFIESRKILKFIISKKVKIYLNKNSIEGLLGD